MDRAEEVRGDQGPPSAPMLACPGHSVDHLSCRASDGIIGRHRGGLGGQASDKPTASITVRSSAYCRLDSHRLLDRAGSGRRRGRYARGTPASSRPSPSRCIKDGVNGHASRAHNARFWKPN